MHLGRIGYYSDFFVYPVLILVLSGAGLLHSSPDGAAEWIATFLLCLVLWTLIEYLMHRFALHHIPYVREMHDDHHVNERAPIGTPTYLSLGLHAALALIPLWILLGFALASAATGGLMLGYLWYISVHHILHHWHPSHSGYFYGLKRRHASHHHVDEHTNFGVTSSFWDRIFGTIRP